MRVGLFVPCFVDAFEPEVAIATLELLEKLGHEVVYPQDQTCCGQPLANSGCDAEARGAEALFVRNFADFDCVVAPSGSCVHHVRAHLTAIEQTATVRNLRARTYDLVEFLHDVAPAEFPWAYFPHKIAYHNGCQSLRGLGHASASETMGPAFSKPLDLLRRVAGIEIVAHDRADECCGFGGTFSVNQPDVSAKMGQDKVHRLADSGARYVVSADSSCLLHQAGCAGRLGLGLEFRHIAAILNGAAA